MSKAIHLGASGVLVDSRGNILLGKRSSNDSVYPDFYCTPGGGVEFGETIDDTLRREFIEETGLNIAVGPFSSIQECFRDSDHHTVLVFKQVYFERGPVRPKALDGFSEVAWWSRKDVGDRSNLITPATFGALRVFLRL